MSIGQPLSIAVNRVQLVRSGGFGSLYLRRIYCKYQKQVHHWAAVIDYLQNVRGTRHISAVFLRMRNLHLDSYCC